MTRMTDSTGGLLNASIRLALGKRPDLGCIPAASCRSLAEIAAPIIEIAVYHHERHGQDCDLAIAREIVEEICEADVSELTRCIKHSCIGLFVERRPALFGLRWKYNPATATLQLLRRRNMHKPGYCKLTLIAEGKAQTLRDYERVFRENLLNSPAMFISSEITEHGLSIDYTGFDEGETIRRQFALHADFIDRLTHTCLMAHIDRQVAGETKAYEEFVAAKRTGANLRSKISAIRRTMDKVVKQSGLPFFELVDLDFDPFVTITYRVLDLSDKKRTFRFVCSRATLRTDFAAQLSHHHKAREAYDRHVVKPSGLAA